MQRHTLALAVAAVLTAGQVAAQDQPVPARSPIPCHPNPEADSAAACPGPYSIVPTDHDRAVARTLSELLQARAPGLYVRATSGIIGAASGIQLRGARHVVVPNAPLVIVDGIRVAGNGPVPGSLPGLGAVSALDDLSPELVDSITVLSGPAATARYGPAAASGALVIATRRGGGPGMHVSGFTGVGARTDSGRLPANYERVGTGAGGGTVRCSLRDQAFGTCTPQGDSVNVYTPIDSLGLLRSGTLWTAGARVYGGGGPVRYTAGVSHGTEQGVLRENSGTRTDLHGRVTARLLPGLRVSVTALHAGRDLRLPVENGNFSPLTLALLAGSGARVADALETIPPIRNTFGTRRTSAAATAAWAPLPWLGLEARYGVDRGFRDGVGHQEAFGGAPELRYATASRQDVRTAAGEAWARLPAFGAARLRLGAGVERTGELMRRSEGDVATNPAAPTSSLSVRLHRKVTGIWAGEGLDWRGTVRLDGVVRRDRLAEASRALWSGSASLGWSLGDEPFFRRPAWLGALRLRAGWGTTETWPPVYAGFAQNENDLFGGACVHPDHCVVDPERATEVEAGVEASLFGLVNARVTGYTDRTARLLSWVPVVNGSVFGLDNVGTVTNRGIEASLGLGEVRTGAARWDVDLLASFNRNRVDGVGMPVGLGNLQRVASGAPLGGYWGIPIRGYADRDGDGTLRDACAGSACEVVLGDTAELLGSPTPTRMVGAQARLRLGSRVTAAARVEHQGGYSILDNAEFTRCRGFALDCRGQNDPAAPLGEQARSVAANVLTVGGAAYVRDASFTRLREVTVTVGAPGGWTGNRAAVELTLGGRNLATWSGYPGLDPETNGGVGSNLISAQGFILPIPRTWIARLDVRF
ncbi:MAG TPA: TonB-dependent receptor [Longimicrobium sp.]|nr:TonB-dependent receptor [Longimicrobium sp.]